MASLPSPSASAQRNEVLLDLERRGAVLWCDQHQGVAQQRTCVCRPYRSACALRGQSIHLRSAEMKRSAGAPNSICLAMAEDAANDRVALLPVLVSQPLETVSRAFLRLAAASRRRFGRWRAVFWGRRSGPEPSASPARASASSTPAVWVSLVAMVLGWVSCGWELYFARYSDQWARRRSVKGKAKSRCCPADILGDRSAMAD